jgi:hypothetical protein
MVTDLRSPGSEHRPASDGSPGRPRVVVGSNLGLISGEDGGTGLRCGGLDRLGRSAASLRVPPPSPAGRPGTAVAATTYLTYSYPPHRRQRQSHREPLVNQLADLIACRQRHTKIVLSWITTHDQRIKLHHLLIRQGCRTPRCELRRHAARSPCRYFSCQRSQKTTAPQEWSATTSYRNLRRDHYELVAHLPSSRLTFGGRRRTHPRYLDRSTIAASPTTTRPRNSAA